MGKAQTNLGVSLALVTMIFVSGCDKKTEGKAELGEAQPTSRVVVKEDVATTVTELVSLPKVVMVTGSLIADEQSDVASRRGGIVREVLVDRGSVIKQGDVMVRLDTVDAVNSLEQTQAAATELLVRLGLSSADEKFDPEKQPDVKVARAALDLATRNFERDKKLSESKVISPEEYDRTRNTFNTASQNYELAQAQARQLYRTFQTALTRVKSSRQLLDDMTVRAPFDGAVVERFVALGESLTDGARIASLVRTDPLRLVLDIAEQDVGRIHEGQTVYFTADAFPGQRFEGVVKNISPSLNADTRDLKVEAMVPNPEKLLKPGLFATAQVQLEAEREGVRIPSTAVRRRGDAAQVFIVKDGITQAAMVVVGDNRKGYIEILDGLKGGETIVSNAAEVEDGIRIQ